MIEEIKTRLGDVASNFTDKQIELALKDSMIEIKGYCKRELDEELENIASRVAVIKLNRMNTEGLASQSYSGANESYIDGYPSDIKAVLDRKRKIKVV